MTNQVIAQGYIDSNMIITIGYSISVPVVVPQPVGGGKRAIPQQPKRVSPEALGLIRDYLELKTRNA